MTTLLASLCLAAPLLCAPTDDEVHWLLVRSAADDVAGLSWQRIGQAYLSRWPWREVEADGLADDPSSHRFVVGTPFDNAAVARLGPGLGITWQDGRLLLDGTEVQPGTGLALVTPDPDEAGLLVIFTGADAASVAECFRTSVDLLTPGTLLVRGGRPLDRAALLRYDTRLVEVVRLDAMLDDALDTLAGAAPTAPPDRVAAQQAEAPTRATLPDRALAASRAVTGWAHVYAPLMAPPHDLLTWHLELLRHHGARLAAARSLFAGHDLAAWAREAVTETERVLLPRGGERTGPRPVFHFVYAPPNGTNAAVFGFDPVTGRPAVLINLCAFDDVEALRVALVHEALHTLQPVHGARLVDRALREGVASRLSQLLRPGTSDALALMWTPAKLATARARHDEIVAAFRELADSLDDGAQTPWMLLGRSPDEPAGLPDRCGYYVGWAAVVAWTERHRGRPLADLASLPADELLAALH